MQFLGQVATDIDTEYYGRVLLKPDFLGNYKICPAYQ